jgi:hypothetical protein
MSCKKDIVDHLSNSLLLETAQNFNDNTVSIDEEQIKKIKESRSWKSICENAENLVAKFENEVLSQEIKNIIVNDVRSDLLRNTRWSKTIDIALIIVQLVLAFALAFLPTVIFTDIEILQQIKGYLHIYCYTISILFLLNFILLVWARCKN